MHRGCRWPLIATLVIGLPLLLHAQSPSTGVPVTRPAGSLPPQPNIPPEILKRIPMSCQAMWEQTAPSVRLGVPSAGAPSSIGHRVAGGAHGQPHAMHGGFHTVPASSGQLTIKEQLRQAHLAALQEEEDPLSGLGPSNRRRRGGPKKPTQQQPSRQPPDPHEALWAEDCYPSASTCAKCHPKHYEQWRASSHSYSSVSPMFQVFEQTISELSQGTVGYFCLRCHAPVATQMSQIDRTVTLLDAPRVIREGITCIACHRVNERYGKTNGHRRIEPGDIHQPVYSGGNGQGVAHAVANKDQYKVKLSPADKGPGQPIHVESRFFKPLSESEFCMPCHQVSVHPGIALEVVWNQYRNAPARKRGISCQDCHMGHTPGKANGYECGHIAELGGKPFGAPRKISNHNFWGPNYSIAHPGLFPHNPKADRWSPRQWLHFDWRAGWGTEAFERSLPDGAGGFPPPWDDADDRRDARKIIDANLRRAGQKRETAIATLSSALRLDGPHLDSPPRLGAPLKFAIHVCNTSDGHNFPTASLGAQPQQWLNVSVIDPFGKIVFESGYLDSNGDLAEVMSEDVLNDRIKPDYQLFNLQTKFLITNVKGPDREFPLPVNLDIDQLPFLRPGNVPFSVLNHPPFIRMEAHSIPPEGFKTARYVVPASAIKCRGTYRISVRFRARLEPPYFMRLCKSTPEMIRRMNEQIMDVAPQTTEIFVR